MLTDCVAYRFMPLEIKKAICDILDGDPNVSMEHILAQLTAQFPDISHPGFEGCKLQMYVEEQVEAYTRENSTDTNRLSESNTISKGLSLRPLESENVDDNVGSGGCTAHTLEELNVFATVAAAMTALNRNGEIELQKRIQQFGGDYETAKVYVPNDKWCSVVIKTTCIENGFDFKKLKLKEVKLSDELKSGLFFIDGIQNRDWQKRVKYVNDPAYKGAGPDTDPKSWRHSIAVIDGMIHEQNDEKILTKWLWLNDDNTVDVNKGYMRNILKVYRLTPKSDQSDTEDESIQPPVKKLKTSNLVPEARQQEINDQAGPAGPQIIDAVPA